jgi:hypothetical protein
MYIEQVFIGSAFFFLYSRRAVNAQESLERNFPGLWYGVIITPVRHALEADIAIVCCAYECLRTINYLAHSSLIDIQNLLILGNVISNNMNAGVAWTLLGISYR